MRMICTFFKHFCLRYTIMYIFRIFLFIFCYFNCHFRMLPFSQIYITKSPLSYSLPFSCRWKLINRYYVFLQRQI
eukprot:UN05857